MAEIYRASEIYKKDASTGNFSAIPDYFGTAPSLINATKNNPNHNLEEQFLLGENCIVSYWTDDSEGMARVKKEFRSENITDGFYYTIESTPTGIDKNLAYFEDDFVSFSDLQSTDSTTQEKSGAIHFSGVEAGNQIKRMIIDKEVGADGVLAAVDSLYNYYFEKQNDGSYALIVEKVKTGDRLKVIKQISLWYRPAGVTPAAGEEEADGDLIISIKNLYPAYLVGKKVFQRQEILHEADGVDFSYKTLGEVKNESWLI